MALRLTLWVALTFALVLSSLVLQGVFHALSSPDDWLAFASEVGQSRDPRAVGAASAASASASLVSATEGVLAALRESPLSWQVSVHAPNSHTRTTALLTRLVWFSPLYRRCTWPLNTWSE